MNEDICNRLKRDYIHNPLKKIPMLDSKGRLQNTWELPYKEDIEYLYIELNLNKNDIIKLLNISNLCLSKAIKTYNIKKSQKLKIFFEKTK